MKEADPVLSRRHRAGITRRAARRNGVDRLHGAEGIGETGAELLVAALWPEVAGGRGQNLAHGVRREVGLPL